MCTQVIEIRVLSEFGCASYMWCLRVNTSPYTLCEDECIFWETSIMIGSFLNLACLLTIFDCENVLMDYPFILKLGVCICSLLCIIEIHWKLCALVLVSLFSFLAISFYFSVARECKRLNVGYFGSVYFDHLFVSHIGLY